MASVKTGSTWVGMEGIVGLGSSATCCTEAAASWPASAALVEGWTVPKSVKSPAMSAATWTPALVFGCPGSRKTFAASV